LFFALLDVSFTLNNAVGFIFFVTMGKKPELLALTSLAIPDCIYACVLILIFLVPELLIIS